MKKLFSFIGRHIKIVIFIVFVVISHLLIKSFFSRDTGLAEYIFETMVVISSFVMYSFCLNDAKKDAHEIFKEEKKMLEYKALVSLMQHVDHELKSPVMALSEIYKNIFDCLNQVFNYIRTNDNVLAKDIFMGCELSSKINSKRCQVCFLNPNKNKMEFLLTQLKLMRDSIETIDNTLALLKESKSNKRENFNNKSIGYIIKKAADIYKTIAKNNLIIEVDETLFKYSPKYGNPIDLYNVFSNHIQNSMEAHSLFISFAVHKIEDEIMYLYIIDNGNGIPGYMLKDIYKTNSSSKGTGRGFGMYLCRKILQDSYKGDEKIIKSDSKGTVIEITIPVVKLIP